MADSRALTLAFLSEHPSQAARVLETLPVAEASALVAEIPARIGAPVLAAMLPPAAARILAALDDERALGLLTVASAQAAVAMLRHVAEPRRTLFVTSLPTAVALATRVLLGFPEDAVGAWSDPEVIALEPATRAADALQRVRQGQEVAIERVLIIDSERRVIGEVTIEALLHAQDGLSIASLMHVPLATLPAMMPIATAAGLETWGRTSVLPVVDREQRLIGVLRRATITRALRERVRRTPTNDASSLAGILAASYWSIVAGLAGATLSLLPPVKRVLPEDQ